MEPREFVAYVLLALIAVALACGYLYLSRHGRSERRLERVAERHRKARRTARRRSEVGAELDG